MSYPQYNIGDLCEIIAGATPKSGVEEFWDGDVLWATPKDLSDLDEQFISDTPRKITSEGLSSCSAKVLPPNSVLFSSRAPIGLVAINTRPMATNQGFKSFVPNSEKLNSRFLYWWLLANRKQLQAKGRGATFKEVSKAIVEKIQIPLPPLEEQKRIAGILDAADILRAKRREALAKLDDLLQSTFLDLFGDPVTNPKGWEVESLGNICDVRDGTHDSPKYVDEGYPLLTSKNFKNGEIDYEGANLITEEDFQKINKRSKVDLGDLVLPMIGTIGNPVLVQQEPDFAIKNVALIKLSETSPNNKFVRALLCSHYFDNITSKANRGGTQKFVALKDLRGMPIPLPPLDLQQRFAEIVSSVEEQKAKMRKHLEQLDDLFASLQQRAFRGDL